MKTRKNFSVIRVINKDERECHSQKVYLKHNEKLYRVTYENSKGSPLGFDYKHCVAVYNTASDTWNNVIGRDYIEEHASIRFDYGYYCTDKVFHECATDFADAAMKAIEELFG